MGTPAFRLWKIGTHRMLAIWSGPSVDFAGGDGDHEHPEFPASIQRVFRPTKNGIFADFEVCALEPEKPQRHARSLHRERKEYLCRRLRQLTGA